MFDENRLVNLLVHGNKTKTMHTRDKPSIGMRPQQFNSNDVGDHGCPWMPCVRHVFTNKCNSKTMSTSFIPGHESVIRQGAPNLSKRYVPNR